MSISISPSQANYLVSLMLETTGHRYFLPGVLMNPLDRDSLPNDEMEFIPFPLFEGERHQRPNGASSQYRQALASLRARIEDLEGDYDPESATDYQILDGSSLDSESLWDAVRPGAARHGVVLADNYQEMTEEESVAHHYLLDSYRITYHRHSSATTTPPSPRTIVIDGQDRYSSSGDRHLSETLADDTPRLPRRSVILEPLSIHDFVVEVSSGEIDTFYDSIYGIIFSDG